MNNTKKVIEEEDNEGIEIFIPAPKNDKSTIKDLFDKFELKELDRHEEQTRIITIVGKKHSGKTSVTYGFTGSKYYLSYDKNSAKPLETLLPRFFMDEKKAEKDFHFINASEYYNELSAEKLKEMKNIDEILRKWQEGAVNTYYYTIFLLDELAKKESVDYLIIDGSEILYKCCEQIMRVRHNLVASQGFKERNWWKERNILWDVIHQKALNVAKKGVIYTTYLKVVEQEEDEIINMKDVPNWYGSMMMETEIILETFTQFKKDGEKHYSVRIESKISSMPEAATLDVTNRTIIDALKEYYKKYE